MAWGIPAREIGNGLHVYLTRRSLGQQFEVSALLLSV